MYMVTQYRVFSKSPQSKQQSPLNRSAVIGAVVCLIGLQSISNTKTETGYAEKIGIMDMGRDRSQCLSFRQQEEFQLVQKVIVAFHIKYPPKNYIFRLYYCGSVQHTFSFSFELCAESKTEAAGCFFPFKQRATGAPPARRFVLTFADATAINDERGDQQ